MYEKAEIQCTNTGFKLKLYINEIYTHEFFDCLYRIINCVAKVSYYTTILFKYKNKRLNVRFMNLTAERAMMLTTPKYYSKAVRSCWNGGYWNILSL